MSKYSIGNRTTNTTTANPTIEVIAPAAGTKVTAVTITLAAATASAFGIGRAAAVGITPTSPAVLVKHDAGRPDTLTATALAWATPPTIPATFIARTNLPATIGATATLSFPDGISLATGESLVVWNLGATGVSDINVTVDE
jgi:hypothetical protein